MLYTMMVTSTPLLKAEVLSIQEEDFPASIKVKCSEELCKNIASNFLTDQKAPGFVALYIENKSDYERLKGLFSKQLLSSSKTSPITMLQSNREATKNFTEKSASGAAYHTYETMLSEIQNIQSNNPAIVKVINLGSSASGTRNIWAVKVSDNVTSEEDEPSSFITGGIHGNERPGPETVLHILNGIVDGYSNSQEIKDLVNKTQMWFIPIVNPDGHTANRRTNNNGVDLNRDYPTAWNNFQLQTSVQSETTAILNNLQARHYVVGLDLHTFGEMVMYPWAHTSSSIQDLNVFTELGNEIGVAMGGYRVKSLYDFFGQIEGGSLDYEYGAFGTIAFGEELGTSHNPPISTTQAIARRNFKPAINLLSRVLKSTITGKVTDVATGNPIVATIKVHSIDTGGPRNPYKSDSQYGRYYRIVPSGNYTVTVSAQGYPDKTFNNVQTNDSAQTILDVQLDANTPPPPPGGKVLENGVPATGLAAAVGQDIVYTMNIPTGATNIKFDITGGTGDADLYVKFGAAPTDSNYDCRPYKSGNKESCTSTQAGGTYYVRLKAYSTFSGVSLTGSFTDGGTPPDGVDRIETVTVARGAWSRFTQVLPAGLSNLAVTISGGTGDADLYVRKGAASTSSKYDCRPYKNGNVESCDFANPAADTWHIDVYGYNAASDVTLKIKAN